ncbi:MAG: DinB family protein [Sediminibacterium sp.]|nr:DinB family protein [Sediminibacterium sp.]
MIPKSGTYPAYMEPYIRLVSYPNVVTALEQAGNEVKAILSLVTDHQKTYRYAENKWSINELIVHCTDTERILAYRSLRFARNDDQQPLSFDENKYAVESYADNRSLQSCIEEFLLVRQSSIQLFKTFTSDTLQRSGKMTLGTVEVNALGFFIAGHALHHARVLKERYLNSI